MTETMTLENGPMRVPAGGIASFRLSDEDLANLDREQDEQLAEEVYGSGGISRFTEIASDMAGLGRYGDDVVVHAQTGELVIPKSVLDDSPEIREVVYQALREQGIEDPEQYVVGSGSASINPNTGLAEYGFFSGIKRAFKKVVKVVKKIAPIVLPIAMTMMFPALGPIYGAALGSGIGTLIQGGSIKDALKSAAISGLSGAAYSGFTGPGTFSQNVSGALADPGARFAQVGGQLKSGFSGQGFNLGQQFTGVPSTGPTGQSPADARGADYQGLSDSSFDQVNNPGLTSEQIQARDLSISNANNNMSGYNTSGAPDSSMAGRANMTTNNVAGNNVAGNNFAGNNVAGNNSGQNSFMDNAKNYYNKANDFLTIGEAPQSVDQILQQSNINPANATLAERSMASTIANNQPGTGILSGVIRNAPKIALGGYVAKKTGLLDKFFETPPDDPVDVLDRDSQGNVITGATLIANDPDKYMIPGLNTATITYGAPKTAYQSYLDQYNPNNRTYASASPTIGGPFQRVAQGGEIFPRRNGGIMPDEGVPGKDSVRAMLMPGEFVMTTDAVKGMGNGNLQQGIQNMYGVMANLERKGRMA